jgi:hypothetical protein
MFSSILLVGKIVTSLICSTYLLYGFLLSFLLVKSLNCYLQSGFVSIELLPGMSSSVLLVIAEVVVVREAKLLAAAAGAAPL